MQELKLKDEQCEKLSRVRNELESELEELTASLFQVCFEINYLNYFVQRQYCTLYCTLMVYTVYCVDIIGNTDLWQSTPLCYIHLYMYGHWSNSLK